MFLSICQCFFSYNIWLVHCQSLFSAFSVGNGALKECDSAQRARRGEAAGVCVAAHHGDNTA